ncbi:hypothetical protein [Allokutzneria sp. NRRL B-24872]|uniref:hypothetical protein n=1 Tax=Allokutzneria sp. NRRL B-24872 TaxID=1137961 RepID=UPI000A383F4E|nr:hypothetical protein [Allokutzneria sp. NRRL B-24872]
MRARKFAAACLVAGSALAVTSGVATASEVTIQGHWETVAYYPATTQGWADCWNAKVNVAKGDCKLNSDTGATVDLWAWVS